MVIKKVAVVAFRQSWKKGACANTPDASGQVAVIAFKADES